MDKFCTNCGAKLSNGQEFCSSCGNKVSRENNVAVNNDTSTSKKTTNGFSIAGFIVSIVSSILCCGSFNIISIVLSIIGLIKAKDYGSGKGFAIAGIIISVVMLLLWFVLGIVLSNEEFLNEIFNETASI